MPSVNYGWPYNRWSKKPEYYPSGEPVEEWGRGEPENPEVKTPEFAPLPDSYYKRFPEEDKLKDLERNKDKALLKVEELKKKVFLADEKLNDLINYANRRGFEIDSYTQKMIDEARETTRQKVDARTETITQKKKSIGGRDYIVTTKQKVDPKKQVVVEEILAELHDFDSALEYTQSKEIEKLESKVKDLERPLLDSSAFSLETKSDVVFWFVLSMLGIAGNYALIDFFF